LVLIGDSDPWVRVPEAQVVAGAMNGHGVLHIFAGAGHGSLETKSPEEFQRVVTEWLKKSLFQRGL
jgi:pimeloyl-ACP methyl ester carboxylesterase